MERVTIVANMGITQAIVGYMSVDVWTLLETQDPKTETGHFRWERFMHHKVDSFNNLNRWNRENFGINKYKESGCVKFNLDTGGHFPWILRITDLNKPSQQKSRHSVRNAHSLLRRCAIDVPSELDARSQVDTPTC